MQDEITTLKKDMKRSRAHGLEMAVENQRMQEELTDLRRNMLHMTPLADQGAD